MNAPEHRIRITARVPPAIDATIREAAALSGTTVSQFLAQAALEKANAVINREHFITVTNEDAVRLIAALDTPSTPNAALARAFARHRNQAEHEQDGIVDRPAEQDT